MFCRWCGTQLPDETGKCPKCGRTEPPPAGEVGPAVEQAFREAARAARDLGAASARLADKVTARATEAARDPKGASVRVARRVARELDDAREELERALREL